MERTINAPVDKVFALLTDAKWLETRYLALGDLSASCKVKKTGGVVITMKRRIHRELSAVLSKVLSPDSDLEVEEKWSGDKNAYAGTSTAQIVGKPITITLNYELEPAGKGCVLRIEPQCKVRVPFIGGVVEKFILGQTEESSAAEVDYLADFLKKNK